MPDLAADLRAGLSDFGETVILPGGRIVLGLPSVATAEDALEGDSIVSGRTRTIRFASADVEDLKPGGVLSWGGKNWKTLQLSLRAGGRFTIAFLGGA
jgi:hypothetical protein